jgi:hypothetical protein
MRNKVLTIGEEGMCVDLHALLDAMKMQMKVLEQDIQNASREIIPEFSKNFGWFLHTTTVGAIPLTKYCLLQSIYSKIYDKSHTIPEITICDMMELLTKEQLEVVLPIVFND